MNSRENLITKLKNTASFDVIIIGGGATGLGAAIDAVTRGYKTLVIERKDFAKATSSKSTKLIHGGLRYLGQGNVALVKKALKERYLLYKNAPHLVRDMSFILPCYKLTEIPFYLAGLKLYDILAGYKKEYNSEVLSAANTVTKLPYLNKKSLKAGLLYHDGAFDDARMAIALAKGVIEKNGLAINYMEATDFIKEDGIIRGLVIKDAESKEVFNVKSNCVINATGIFADEIRKKDDATSTPLISPAQGVHIVISNKNRNITEAMIIPKTKDGRVLFIVPWYDHLILGTTDTKMPKIDEDAIALKEEINFIVNTANDYFDEKISNTEILSIYAGQRPLIDDKQNSSTKKLSRDEKIIISNSNLITIAGGKWTTYRAMGEHVINFAISHKLVKYATSVTVGSYIYGYTTEANILNLPQHLRVYGKNYAELAIMEGFNDLLHKDLPYNKAQITYAITHEYARTIEDVLARRLRALFINAKATMEIAPTVAALLQQHLKKDDAWKQEELDRFHNLAKTYTIDYYL